MCFGVPVLDSAQRGHHHLHKFDPSRDLSSGLGLRLWGQCLNLRKIGGLERVSRQWVIMIILICAGLNGTGFMWNLLRACPTIVACPARFWTGGAVPLRFGLRKAPRERRNRT
jgi:hypothetical protein